MAFLICMVAVCPVRTAPAHRSEQTSQLLFGEMCEWLEQKEDFVRIKVTYDNYDGWCQASQLAEAEAVSISANTKLAGEWINNVNVNGEMMKIPFASTLTFLDEKGYSDQYKITYSGTFINQDENENKSDLVKKYAFTFLNTPYLWGGRSVFGIDCSGFTQVVFKCLNISLLRDAYQQAERGETIESLSEATCGDLAFFNNESGKITHVGILLDPQTIIHASGKVRIDNMNDFGIQNRFTNKQTHALKLIKRVLTG